MKVIKLLGNRLQVRRLPQDDRASEHVFYSPRHKPEQMMHEVVAVGTGHKLKNGTFVQIPVKPGDRIFLDQYRLNDRTDAGEDTWIVNLDACSLVVES